MLYNTVYVTVFCLLHLDKHYMDLCNVMFLILNKHYIESVLST